MGILHLLLLGIRLPSQRYLGGHMSNFINIQLFSNDPVGKAALSTQLTREGQKVLHSMLAVQCQEILQSVSEECFVPTEENT